MSLSKNIFANYISHIYISGIGILILPMYIKYLGEEAYGLVGFFTMLQSCFALLDFGLTPTIARESARYHGGKISPLDYRKLFRSLGVIFVLIAIFGGLFLYLISDLIATKWLNNSTLEINEVVLAVRIMAVSASLRWLSGLFRGVITGAERLVWLSSFNTLITTFRFIGVFASMYYFGFSPKVFFLHQLFVAISESIGLFLMSNSLLPKKKDLSEKIGWSIQTVKPILKFALSLGFTSSVWICVTQIDRFILSGILSLEEYGYFTLAVLVASGIMMISGPISNAILPHMSRLNAEGKHARMIKVYRDSTQLVSIIVGSASIIVAFFAEPLLYVWTNDYDLALKASPILRLYAIGNAFLAMSAFPYYLQYALGNLRYHLIGNIVTSIILVPAIVYSSIHFGGIGAAYTWVGINGASFLFWTYFVHHKLEPGLHLKWFVYDGILIYLPGVSILYVLSFLWPVNIENRLWATTHIFVLGIVALIVCAMSSSYGRQLFIKLKQGEL